MGIFGQSTDFYDDVEKATSETNTNEDWTLILEVCDKVSINPRNAKDCLKAIMRRMAHNDPHVVMQAITLLDACVSNCGKTFHLEIASREFQTEFIRLLGKAQPKVQSKMCQVLKGWAEGDFKNDPELNLIPSLYAKLRQEHYDFSNFNEKTAKSGAKIAAAKDPNVVSNQKEEEDLAKAIELSLKDVKNSPKQGSTSASGGGSANYPSLYPTMTSSSSTTPSQAPEPRKVRALYDFEAAEENELTFVAGEIIHVTDDSDPNWWKGFNQRSEGLFPSNFVTADLSIDPERLEINQQHKMNKSSQFEEDAKELQQKTEAAAAAAATQIIDIDEQKIDRLLHLLNEANPEDPSQDTEEMLRLEQEVHQMGPLIDAELERVDRKHAQLSQLSSDLVDAINLYHSLMRDDRNNLGSPYNMPGSMPGMSLPGAGYAGHPNIMYGSNPVFGAGFGPHSLSMGMNSLPYSPPAGNYPGSQHQMSRTPIQFQNGHVAAVQQNTHQPHSLPHMNHQMMPLQQQQLQNNPPQQPGIYGQPQNMLANNLNAVGDTQQLQQQQQHVQNQQQQYFNHMLPSQQQQHFMQQQAPSVTTTAATPAPTNHLATSTPNHHASQQQQPTNQFISPQHPHVQQQAYINSPSNQPSTNPHLYNHAVGDQQQHQPQQQAPTFMGAAPNAANTIQNSSGHLDQFGQLQQQMANMNMAGTQQYHTNQPQNIPIYQQQL